MRVSMASKIDFTIECSIADTTRKWFEASMFAAVGDEIRRLAKRFAALQALMWLLACVDVCVFFHVGFLMESLAAVFARERSSV